MSPRPQLQPSDALLVVNPQLDFLPGGGLAVPRGDEIIPFLNRWADAFAAAGLPVFAARDWHPDDHASFREHGGPWPRHCVQGTPGAGFAAGLRLPRGAVVLSKGAARELPGSSAFEATGLEERLRASGATRLFIGGLATDDCILHTVEDAVSLGFRVVWLEDASRAFEVRPGDALLAIETMRRLGARSTRWEAGAP